ncbi:MAG: cytochrome c oxidase subunit II [Acidobacteriota bacterium]
MDWITGRFMLPPQGSAYAGEVDDVFLGLYWLSQVLFWGITLAAIYFAWRYRYKEGRVTPHITHNTTLEVLWSAGPTLLCVGIFFWGLNGWMKYAVAPGDAMEVLVTGKQWLWQFEYPDGSRTINDLHVPVGKPVKFTMTSEDVLHDFFVPDMRVKHDIIPGRYTQIWFKPDAVGKHTFTCAEYCGKDHSGMKGIMTVESDADFAKFLETGGTEWEDYFPPKANRQAEWGKLQYERKGCNSCHSVDGSKSKGPSWKGIYMKMEAMNSGKSMMVDDDYIRDSMLNPQSNVVQGYEPIMPTFQGTLKPNEIRGLVAYIQSLK